MTKPPVVILGPTASGKSDVAMEVAQLIGEVEIVAVDAMMVYRGMDIGTGKPSELDQRAVPHHCLDLADPSERFTVADFQRCARNALAEIDAKGSRALLVAGTGMYLQALIDGFTIPGEYPDAREELETWDTPKMFDHLQKLDPVAGAKIEPTNRRRIMRALEVCIGSGMPFSSFGPGADTYPATQVQQVGILWPREVLAQRIQARVHSMMAAGWLDEVRALIDGPEPMSHTAKQALGYNELIAHLEGQMSLEEAVDQTVLRTRQFAVRQERWFRRDPRVEWVNVDPDINLIKQVVPKVLNCLERN